MADQETLDSPPLPPSDDKSQSQSSSSSDPSLSRSLSSSRLNAEAPAFVPGRAQPQPPAPQSPRMMIPRPPPPSAMHHMYHHPPELPPPQFHGPIHVQNHHPHHLPLNHHHHQNRHVNNQFIQSRNHGYFSGGGGEQEVEVLVKKDRDRRKSNHQKKDHNKDHGDGGGGGATDSNNGLSDETVQKIINQVEYYFSDMNLATTDHLMRFINKDSEGYVPISIVGSFKKIKALTGSNSQLATVLRSSSKLTVSEDGKKVRRQHPITESDIEELQSRIVVAENLPEDHCYQNLMKIFSAIGSVKNIRTCQPQNSGNGASSASRSAKSEGTQFSNKVHAFVEYETIELAEKAVAELNDEGNWRSGLRLRLMLKLQPQTKDSKHVQGRGRKGHEEEAYHEEDNATMSEQQPNGQLSEEVSEDWDTHEHTGEELGNDNPGGGQKKGRNRGRGKERGRGQQLHHNHRGNPNVGASPANNPVTSEQPVVAKQPPGPRMPDGTRGFSMGRGKPLAVGCLLEYLLDNVP